jgi:hypothetical protein
MVRLKHQRLHERSRSDLVYSFKPIAVKYLHVLNATFQPLCRYRIICTSSLAIFRSSQSPWRYKPSSSISSLCSLSSPSVTISSSSQSEGLYSKKQSVTNSFERGNAYGSNGYQSLGTLSSSDAFSVLSLVSDECISIISP